MATYNGFKSIEGKEFYHKAMMHDLRERNILGQFAKKTVLPKHHSDTISWRKRKPVPVQYKDGKVRALVEGITPDGNKLEFVEYKAKIKEYGDWIPLTQKLSNLAYDPILTEASQGLGESSGDTFEALRLETLYTSPNVVYGGNKTKTTITATDVMNVELLHRVKAYFEKRNVEPAMDGNYIMIISPDVEFDLKNSTTENGSWIDISKYTNKEHVMKGEIGTFMGFKFIVYNKLGTELGGSDSRLPLTKCIALGKDAYGDVDLDGNNMSIRYNKPGSQGNDPLAQRQSVAWKCEGYACRLIYPEATAIVKVPTQLGAMPEITEEDNPFFDSSVAGTAGKYQSYDVQNTEDVPSSEIVD